MGVVRVDSWATSYPYHWTKRGSTNTFHTYADFLLYRGAYPVRAGPFSGKLLPQSRGIRLNRRLNSAVSVSRLPHSLFFLVRIGAYSDE